jgi:RimJ/RimL family protein N-acetyltransferase
MSLPDNFDIRYTVSDDLSVLQDWFSDPQERVPFPFETDGEMNEVLKNWVGFSRYKAGLTGILDQVPCAMGTLLLMPYRKVAHQCAFYLIVGPAFRRRGFGGSMIRNLLHLAATRFSLESVYAEVYEPNPLVRLLEVHQFKIVTRQENFVKINGRGHTRILMEHFFHGR